MADPVYFDSCLFIELLQKANEERLEACEHLVDQAKRNELIIVTSALSITEVNQLPDSPLDHSEASKVILAFFENPFIAIRPVDRRTAEYAHELTRLHGLTNIDAIHVATAVLTKATVLYTYDGIKKKRKGILSHNLQIGTPPMRIETPPDPHAGTLFARKKLTDPANPGTAISLHPLSPEKAITAALKTPLKKPPKGSKTGKARSKKPKVRDESGE